MFSNFFYIQCLSLIDYCEKRRVIFFNEMDCCLIEILDQDVEFPVIDKGNIANDSFY